MPGNFRDQRGTPFSRTEVRRHRRRRRQVRPRRNADAWCLRHPARLGPPPCSSGQTDPSLEFRARTQRTPRTCDSTHVGCHRAQVQRSVPRANRAAAPPSVSESRFVSFEFATALAMATLMIEVLEADTALSTAAHGTAVTARKWCRTSKREYQPVNRGTRKSPTSGAASGAFARRLVAREARKELVLAFETFIKANVGRCRHAARVYGLDLLGILQDGSELTCVMSCFSSAVRSGCARAAIRSTSAMLKS